MTTRLEPVALPCPFCGGDAEPLPYKGADGFRCADVDCPGSGRLPMPHEDGLAFWNRRAAPAPDGMRSDISGLINAAVDDLKIDPRWHEGRTFDERRLINDAFQNGVEVASDAIYRAASVSDGLRAEIVGVIDRYLHGIDREEVSDTEGWWPTSTGAAFGAKVKSDLTDAILAIIAKGEGRE